MYNELFSTHNNIFLKRELIQKQSNSGFIFWYFSIHAYLFQDIFVGGWGTRGYNILGLIGLQNRRNCALGTAQFGFTFNRSLDRIASCGRIRFRHPAELYLERRHLWWFLEFLFRRLDSSCDHFYWRMIMMKAQCWKHWKWNETEILFLYSQFSFTFNWHN